MAQNRLGSGKRLTITCPSGGCTTGLPLKVGSIIGVPQTTQLSGELVDLDLTGEFTFPSDTGAAWAVGDVVYWDDTGKTFTKTSTSNTKAGVASAVKASGAVTGSVRLYPQI